MGKVIMEIRHEKCANTRIYIMETGKGYMVSFSLLTSNLVYKRLDNAIKCAKRLVAA